MTQTVIATRNIIAKKINILGKKQLEAIRCKTRQEYYSQICQQWLRKGYACWRVAGIFLPEELAKVRRWLAGRSRQGWQYILSSFPAGPREEDGVTLSGFVFIPPTKTNEKQAQAVKQLQKIFGLVAPGFPEDLALAGKVYASRGPVPAAVQRVMPYLDYVGVDIQDILEGRATVGWRDGKKEYKIGKDTDKLPQVLAPGRVYVYLRDKDKLFVLPRAQVIRRFPEDLEEEAEQPKQGREKKPDLILFVGPAGSGKTTQMLAALKELNHQESKIFLTSWTGAQTQRLAKKAEEMRLNAKATTLDGFLRAVPDPDSDSGKKFGLLELVRRGLEFREGEPIAIGIDEIFLAEEEHLRELAELANYVPIAFYAAGDPDGQKKNCNMQDLRKIFNIFEVKLTTIHRKKGRKQIVTGKQAEKAVQEALDSGKVVVAPNRRTQRFAERYARKRQHWMCVRNSWKANIAADNCVAENMDKEEITQLGTVFVPNGAVLRLRKTGAEEFETKDGEITRFSKTEQKKKLQLPVISPAKAQGMETEELIFVVLPYEPVKKVDYWVVTTRATEKLMIAVLPTTSPPIPPPA